MLKNASNVFIYMTLKYTVHVQIDICQDNRIGH